MLDISGGDEFHFGSAEGMTNAQLLAAANESVSFDITQGFWQCWLIDKLIASEGDRVALR